MLKPHRFKQRRGAQILPRELPERLVTNQAVDLTVQTHRLGHVLHTSLPSRRLTEALLSSLPCSSDRDGIDNLIVKNKAIRAETPQKVLDFLALPAVPLPPVTLVDRPASPHASFLLFARDPRAVS